jgi:hypothetical protein
MDKEYLKKGGMLSVRKHLENAEKVVKEKRDFMTGKKDELGEDLKNPKNEIDQIMMLVKESEKHASPEIGKLLLALEVDTRTLSESIEEEAKLVDELEKDAKGTTEREILKEVEEELEFAVHLEHQINLLVSIQKLSADIINKVNKEVEDKKWKERACNNLVNLNNIAAYLLTIINDKEVPHLKSAYATLQLTEITDAQENLSKIRASFENLQPNIL